MSSPLTESERFRAALLADDLAAMRRIPKPDLHIHSAYGVRIERVEAWARVALPRPPARLGSLDGMRDYARRVLSPHTSTREGFEFTAEAAIRDAADDGVVLLEMSIDVKFVRLYGNGGSAFLDFIARLSREYTEPVGFRAEIGVSRDRPPAEEIPLAMMCIRSGLFWSIDLYGNESAEPPETYRSLYRAARGLKRKVHVGEFGDARAVAHTMDVLEPHALQHGIAAAGSPELIRRLRDARIRLNVCPSSNVSLEVVPDMAAHPIRILVDSGVAVSIGSDDPMIFGRSVSEEYLALHRAGVLNASELDAIRQDSLHA